MGYRPGVIILALLITSGGAVRPGYAQYESLSERRGGAAGAPLRVQQAVDAPYDGNGRYRLLQEDGVRDVQGLVVLASRRGVKPYDNLSTGDGHWLSERVIFKDVDTAATIIRYTNDPFADQLSYFQGNWSSDGKYVVFRRRPGMWESSTVTHGPMAVNGDGTNLRAVFREYSMVRNHVCSPTTPNVCYAEIENNKRLVAFDIASGRQTNVIREVAPGLHLKISPDGKYLMDRAETSKGKGIWIASVDGREYFELAIPEAIHDSYRFHPNQKKVMFWYEGHFYEEGFVQCDFDGSDMTKVNVAFDWNHGEFGLDRGVESTGFLIRSDRSTWSPREPLFHAAGVQYYDDPAEYNSYASWQPKDQLWTYATRIVRSPHVSELQAFAVEEAPDGVVNRYRICSTSLKKGRALDNPNASPDGTKVLFNSNYLDSQNIFGVVARLPEPPENLKAEWTSAGVHLTWDPPKHHAETAGYHVYGSRGSGVGFVPLTGTIVRKPNVTFKTSELGKSYCYVVTAVDHAGLESGFSGEASPTNYANQRRRIFVEAERASRSPEMWLAFHGDASDLHYVWMRKTGAQGAMRMPVDEARIASLTSVIIWARVKGTSGATFVVDAGQHRAKITADPADDWTWVKADIDLPMTDVSELAILSESYGSAIDCLWLTDDENFCPQNASRINAPPLGGTEFTGASATSPYSAELSWKACAGKTFHHYNVYCGASEEDTADQRTLVASPDRAALVDWPLAPGTRNFYCVTCVDRFGNESVASPPMLVTTPSIVPVGIEKDYDEQISFQAPAPGTYAVWLLLNRNGDTGSGYIDVKCHASPPKPDAGTTRDPSLEKVTPIQGGGTWTDAPDGLSDLSWLSYDQWGRFVLRRGSYVLKIANKTQSKIEKVYITNDLSYKPPGHVSILTGW